jgi:hypothetical protein
LSVHPQVYLPSSKGLYFFDRNYERGLEWYLSHFAGSGTAEVRGELSHSYLSAPEAPARIAALNPDMRLLVCLREPVERAFSEYLDVVKNGRFDGPFETALERFPILLDRGRYATHLQRYVETFGRDRLLVQLLDDLKADGQGYADEVFAFLGVDSRELPPTALKRRMPASEPRSRTVATAAKRISRLATAVGLQRLRSRAKRATVVRNVLYRPFAEGGRPRLDPDLAAQLKEQYTPEVLALDELLGTSTAARWGYRQASIL